MRRYGKEHRLKCILAKFDIIEPGHKISNNVVCAIHKASYQSAHTPSLIRALAFVCFVALRPKSTAMVMAECQFT